MNRDFLTTFTCTFNGTTAGMCLPMSLRAQLSDDSSFSHPLPRLSAKHVPIFYALWSAGGQGGQTARGGRDLRRSRRQDGAAPRRLGRTILVPWPPTAGVGLGETIALAAEGLWACLRELEPLYACNL